MGSISLAAVNNLFWLGRYTERVFTSLNLFMEFYDQMIEEPEYYHQLATDFGLRDQYTDGQDFVYKFLYDHHSENSLYASLTRAHDNAIILREEITSETQCYIQLALDAFNKGQDAASPLYPLIPVKDYLYAFWGSIEDCVHSRRNRDLIRIGRYIERLELYFRMEYDRTKIDQEFYRMTHRLARLESANHIFNPYYIDKLSDLVLGEFPYNKREAIFCLNHLLQE